MPILQRKKSRVGFLNNPKSNQLFLSLTGFRPNISGEKEVVCAPIFFGNMGEKMFISMLSKCFFNIVMTELVGWNSKLSLAEVKDIIRRKL